MKRIIKDSEPEFWSDYKKRHPHDNYDALDNSDDGREIRYKLREHMLAYQKYICAYCSRQITIDNSLNEHIKPKGVAEYAKYSMDYDNLVVSCVPEGTNRTCGAKKGNQYDENLFVSPLQEDCETHFRYFPNGMIEGITENGKYTVELLNLNSYVLKEARRSIYQECVSLHSKEFVKKYYIEPQDGKYRQFCDMVQYFYDNGMYDDKNTA